MRSTNRRWTILIVVSSGLLFVDTCQAILNTIGLAFNIANIWV
jgi:hypothetical protein